MLGEGRTGPSRTAFPNSTPVWDGCHSPEEVRSSAALREREPHAPRQGLASARFAQPGARPSSSLPDLHRSPIGSL